MRRFYGRFASFFTRSAEYAGSLESLGMDPGRLVRLRPDSTRTRSIRGSGTRKSGTDWASSAIRSRSSSAGRISVEKGLELITNIWKRVEQRCDERGVKAEWIIVGDGPYREAMSRELSGRRAHFLGFRYGDELSALYASSDLFAFPSTTDTLGQVVMEAQGCGIPVLATDQGGPKEVIDDGVTGLILPADVPAGVDRGDRGPGV